MSICCGLARALRLLLPLIVGFSVGSLIGLLLVPLLRLDDAGDASCSLESADAAADDFVTVPDTDELFEAVIKTPLYPPAAPNGPATTPAKKSKTGRPRFAAQELGIVDKLLVAVLTSPETYRSLAVPLNRTASHHVSKMVFFSDGEIIGGGDDEQMNLINIQMNEVDAHLHALSYLLNKANVPNYSTYDWVFIVPDTTYVKAFKLHELVSHMSIGTALFIGAPMSSGHCDADTGILFSHRALELMEPRLDECHDYAVEGRTMSENIGVCVARLLNISCTDEWSSKQFRWYRGVGDGKDDDVSRALAGAAPRQDAFNAAHTVHPVLDPAQFYLLHKYYAALEIDSLNALTQNVQQELSELSAETAEGPSWPAGVPAPFRPKNRYEVFKWDYFSETHVFKAEADVNAYRLRGVDAQDVRRVVKDAVAHLAQAQGATEIGAFEKLVGGYRLLDPTRGMDYVLDLRYVYPSGERRMRRVRAVRPLTRAEIMQEVPFVSEENNVTLVVHFSAAEIGAARAFVGRYARMCATAAQHEQRCNHVLMVLTDGGGDHSAATGRLSELTRDVTTVADRCAPYSLFDIVDARRLQRRADLLYTMDMIVAKYGANRLYLTLSPWVELQSEALNRVRLHAIRGYQVYFPIAFFQFYPKVSGKGWDTASRLNGNGGGGAFDLPSNDFLMPYSDGAKHIEVHKDVGRFDYADFGVSAFYGVDYAAARAAGRRAATRAKRLIDVFVQDERELHVMRATEPLITVHFHERRCDADLAGEALSQCSASRRHSVASKAQLATLLLMQHANDDHSKR